MGRLSTSQPATSTELSEPIELHSVVKEAGFTGVEPCLPLLKSPARTGRLLLMWPSKTECVRYLAEEV